MAPASWFEMQTECAGRSSGRRREGSLPNGRAPAGGGAVSVSDQRDYTEERCGEGDLYDFEAVDSQGLQLTRRMLQTPKG